MRPYFELQAHHFAVASQRIKPRGVDRHAFHIPYEGGNEDYDRLLGVTAGDHTVTVLSINSDGSRDVMVYIFPAAEQVKPFVKSLERTFKVRAAYE